MSQFYTLLTAIGQAKLANAISLDQPFSIEQLAIGDGGGAMPDIDASATALVNEVRRAAVNRVETDADNPNWLIVEQVLPPDVGGFTIREAGVYDADGDLIAIGTYPATYKPQLAEGASRTQTIRFVMMVSDTSAITLKVDPAVVLATRGYVDSAVDTHAASRDHPAATEDAQGFVELADQDEAETGTDAQRVMAPLRVFQAIKKLLNMTAPGAGGGLDADTVDGEHGAALHDATKLTGKLPNDRIKDDNYQVGGLWKFSGGAFVEADAFSSDMDPNDVPLGYSIKGLGKTLSGVTTGYLDVMTFRAGYGHAAMQMAYVWADVGGNPHAGLHYRTHKDSSSSNWVIWRRILDTGNTTVDSNGFVKQSSPIIRLYLDRIETNNDFAATLAKQAVGVYRIDDTAGLARSGWQIETPRDANGQIVLYVATRERADHTIEITNYTPVWTDGVVGPGAPTDIPEGRWIDLRLAEPDTDTEAA